MMLGSLLAQALGWVSAQLPDLLARGELIALVVVARIDALMAGDPLLLAVGTSAAGAWRAEVHHYGRRQVVMDLVTPPRVTATPTWLSHNWLLHHIFSSSDAGPILNLSVRLMLVAKFKTAAVNVLPAPIPVQFALARRSLVRHGHVVLALDPAAHRAHILHLAVGIVATVLGPTSLHVGRWSRCRYFRPLPVHHGLEQSFVGSLLVLFVYFAHSPVESVLMVLRYRLVDSCFVAVGRFEALRDVLSVASVVSTVDLVVLAPPLRVNDGIQAGRARPLPTFLA